MPELFTTVVFIENFTGGMNHPTGFADLIAHTDYPRKCRQAQNSPPPRLQATALLVPPIQISYFTQIWRPAFPFLRISSRRTSFLNDDTDRRFLWRITHGSVALPFVSNFITFARAEGPCFHQAASRKFSMHHHHLLSPVHSTVSSFFCQTLHNPLPVVYRHFWLYPKFPFSRAALRYSAGYSPYRD